MVRLPRAGSLSSAVLLQYVKMAPQHLFLFQALAPMLLLPPIAMLWDPRVEATAEGLGAKMRKNMQDTWETIQVLVVVGWAAPGAPPRCSVGLLEGCVLAAVAVNFEPWE